MLIQAVKRAFVTSSFIQIGNRASGLTYEIVHFDLIGKELQLSHSIEENRKELS